MSEEVEETTYDAVVAVATAREMVEDLIVIQRIAEQSQDFIEKDDSLSTLATYNTNVRITSFNAACDAALMAYRADGTLISYPHDIQWTDGPDLKSWDHAMSLAYKVQKAAAVAYDPSEKEYKDLIQRVDAVVALVDSVQGGFILTATGFDYAAERSKFGHDTAGPTGSVPAPSQGVSEGSYL